VAQSPPALTAAMCGGNATAVRAALDAVLDSLGTARAALDAPDPIAALLPWLREGTRVRTVWPPAASEPVDLPAQPEVLLRLGRAGGWVISVAPDLHTVRAARPMPGQEV
ncbi:MAG TPA: prephenate dehydrogenase/arogenate dehydrogenase family protein, partial [Rugosimonospora sp.]|nr:prephenate dehydrogenase/arogenate dehydrogenase family protein [Rugosimonospora sp.]